MRGYDPTTRQYAYAPNPNFGRLPLSGVTRRAPYLLSVDVKRFLGDAVADQEAARALKSSRLGGQRATTVDEITRTLRATFEDPYQLTLDAGDSLLLQRPQVEALEAQQRELRARVDARWRATAEQLADRERSLTPAKAGTLVQQTYRDVIQLLRTGVVRTRIFTALAEWLAAQGETWDADDAFAPQEAAVNAGWALAWTAGTGASWPLGSGIQRDHVNCVNQYRPKVVNSGSCIRPIPFGHHAAALDGSNPGA